MNPRDKSTARPPRPCGTTLLIAAAFLLAATSAAKAQPPGALLTSGSPSTAGSMLEVIQAGGWIGYAILALSLVGLALVIDAFLRIRDDRLVPQLLVVQTSNHARQGQFKKMLTTCEADPSLFGRILASALPEGSFGLDALREAVQQEGEKQVTHLRQRVGYIGLIASIAPVLGLLGTVIGMIRSFQVLGESRGAARPDELAVGISEALVTTCMGLILAVPLLFFHAYFRDRVTRIGLEAATACDRVLRLMALNIAERQHPNAAARGDGPAPSPSPVGSHVAPASPEANRS